MIVKQIKGESGHTRLSLVDDGEKIVVVVDVKINGNGASGAITATDTFPVEDLIELGNTLTLNERADSDFVSQIKSDAIINAKLLRGDFNSL